MTGNKGPKRLKALGRFHSADITNSSLKCYSLNIFFIPPLVLYSRERRVTSLILGHLTVLFAGGNSVQTQHHRLYQDNPCMADGFFYHQLMAPPGHCACQIRAGQSTPASCWPQFVGSKGRHRKLQYSTVILRPNSRCHCSLRESHGNPRSQQQNQNAEP